MLPFEHLRHCQIVYWNQPDFLRPFDTPLSPTFSAIQKYSRQFSPCGFLFETYRPLPAPPPTAALHSLFPPAVASCKGSDIMRGEKTRSRSHKKTTGLAQARKANEVECLRRDEEEKGTLAVFPASKRCIFHEDWLHKLGQCFSEGKTVEATVRHGLQKYLIAFHLACGESTSCRTQIQHV